MAEQSDVRHDPHDGDRLPTLVGLVAALTEAERILTSSASTVEAVARQVGGHGPPPPPWRETVHALQQHLLACKAAIAQIEQRLPALGGGRS